MPYHKGELEVQTRVGVRATADRAGGSIQSMIPASAAAMIRMQRLAVVGSVDARGRVWTSALTGPPGFLSLPDLQSLRIDRMPKGEDPLLENVRHHPEAGVLVVDLMRRRRLRVNGPVQILPGGGFEVHAREAYSNCPLYIQQRVMEVEAGDNGDAGTVRSADLAASQQKWIDGADTFFVATYHAPGGVDASHRGGMPGFVAVDGVRKLTWPDYSGNNMFQSLGNISVHPQAGLLFLDFERGNTLQLTGRARIVWDGERLATFPGAERLVEFEVDEVLETSNALPHRWKFVEYSEDNPR